MDTCYLIAMTLLSIGFVLCLILGTKKSSQ